MTKDEVKRWAYGLAAALLRSDMETCLLDDEPDRERKMAAMDEVIAELKQKGDNP